MVFLLMPMLLVVRIILVGSLPIFVFKTNVCWLSHQFLRWSVQENEWLNASEWIHHDDWYTENHPKPGLQYFNVFHLISISKTNMDIPNFILENFRTPLPGEESSFFPDGAQLILDQRRVQTARKEAGFHGWYCGWKTSESPVENGGKHPMIHRVSTIPNWWWISLAHPRGILRESMDVRWCKNMCINKCGLMPPILMGDIDVQGLRYVFSVFCLPCPVYPCLTTPGAGGCLRYLSEPRNWEQVPSRSAWFSCSLWKSRLITIFSLLLNLMYPLVN